MWSKILIIGCLTRLPLLFTMAAGFDLEDLIKIPEITRDIRYDQETSERVAQSVMNFAHNLAVALDTNDYPNTQIFSPLSIMSALSLLQMGSHGNSFTQLNQIFAQLKNTPPSRVHEEFGWLMDDVHLKSENKRRPHLPAGWKSSPLPHYNFGGNQKNSLANHTIRVSNALFVENGFSLRPSYSYAAQSIYKSEVTPLDFRNRPNDAKDYINSWVNQNTLGKIPVIIDDAPRTDTEMILASVLYFKGFWEKQFFELSRPQPFFPDGPDSIQIGTTFMGNGGVFPFYYSPELNCQIIGMPYNGNQVTMYVIQPIDSTRLKLQQLQKDLTGERLNDLIAKMELKSAILVFPKFHVQKTLHLSEPLRQMGIEDIFSSDLADFSLISDPDESAKEPQVASSSLTFQPAPLAPISALIGGGTVKFSNPLDRYDEAPLIFSRFSEDESNTTVTPEEKEEQPKMSEPMKESENATASENKEPKEDEKSSRKRRQTVPESARNLQTLDELRAKVGLKKPKLYLNDIVHKVDFNVNEQGTEAAAATLASLTKSGPEVTMRCDTPFLLLVRHDDTKLPLFYGIINIPVNF